MKTIQLDNARPMLGLNRSLLFWILITGAAAVSGYAIGKRQVAPSSPASAALGAAGNDPLLVATPTVSVMSAHAPADMTGASGKMGFLRRVVLDFDPRRQPPDEYNQLVMMGKQDGAFRQDIIKQFEQATDPQVKARLATLLTHVGTGDIDGYAEKLMSSTDAAKRADGFRIMTNLDKARVSSDVRRQLIGALEKEGDATALQALIVGMNPGEVRPPQEVAAVVSRLNELSQHPSASVRAAAVSSMARWGAGERAESVIVHAMNDSNPEVTTAAIYASTQAGIRTPAMKSALFELAAQSDSPIDFRRVAASALGSYNLGPDEFNRLLQLRKDLGAKDM
ncbi:MAG: hypothetical protein EOP40_04465 [Rubrivivax sp.]|nr:MAG: hypothetical protein EOP40_04465 [Rubrivivax sp.]